MNILELFKAILYGILEGITEWLPISSTGHMILLNEFLVLNVNKEFWDLFLVAIQFGAILAVIIKYYNKLMPFSFTKTKKEKLDIWLIWLKVFIAIIPAIIVGLIADDWLNHHLYNFTTVTITLIIYGILFIIIESFLKTKERKITNINDLTFTSSFIIGVVELLALIPGTSRSGVTILAALILGCSKTVSAEFSFYLSIPIMLGASILKLIKFFYNGNSFNYNEVLLLLVGMLTALILSLIVIKYLIYFIKKHSFKAFGVYRICLGIILIIYIFLK